mgnify:CR=1 FL=1
MAHRALRSRKHKDKQPLQFDSTESYELSTGKKCREQIHTETKFILATVLLAYSMGTAANFAAWLVGTTKLFLGLPMFLTRYYSHEEHGTQWPTRLLSGAFDALALFNGLLQEQAINGLLSAQI